MGSIILLCSGNLGEIALNHICKKYLPVFVFTDKNSVGIINFCRNNHIPFYAGNPRKETAYSVIDALQCSILLSVNYLFIVEQNMLSLACDYAINFHGSLLPKYRGRTPHVWAIINGEKETGVTAHLMSSEVDNGKIIQQIKFPIKDNDTGYDILIKFNEVYPKLIDEVFNNILDKNVQTIEQEHDKATYFGKRTPDDGEINWEWQKERIRNWVRAQAFPYPGAFSFYGDAKIIIHQVEYSDAGFSFADPNGLVLQGGEQPLIKSPNGALRLLNFECSSNIKIDKGKILCRKSQ